MAERFIQKARMHKAPQVEVVREGGGQLGLTPDGRWTFRLRPPRRLALARAEGT